MWFRIASSVSLVAGTGLFVYHLFSVFVGGGSEDSLNGTNWALHISYTPSARSGLAVGAALIVAGLIGWLSGTTKFRG